MLIFTTKYFVNSGSLTGERWKWGQRGLKCRYREELGRETKNRPFLVCFPSAPLGACPLSSCLTLKHMASPPCLEFALIVGCIVAFQMIDCSCQEQNVKIHEIRIRTINNLSRVLMYSFLLFSLLPSLHPHSCVCVCVCVCARVRACVRARKEDK